MGGAATFFLVSVTAWPLPLYLPLVRRWVLSGAQRPLELSMDFYGRSLYALLGGAAAALLAYGYARWRLRRSEPHLQAESVLDPAESAEGSPPRSSAREEPSLWLPLLYAITAFAFATALFAYQLWGRITYPESPPAPSVAPARVGPPDVAPARVGAPDVAPARVGP
jgi:hypothetical protein